MSSLVYTRSWTLESSGVYTSKSYRQFMSKMPNIGRFALANPGVEINGAL